MTLLHRQGKYFIKGITILDVAGKKIIAVWAIELRSQVISLSQASRKRY
jgi:hypothetical protein